MAGSKNAIRYTCVLAPSVRRPRRTNSWARVFRAQELPSFDQQELKKSGSEEDEDLLYVTLDALDLLADDVEADGLGKGAALANGDDITDFDTESGRAVS